MRRPVRPPKGHVWEVTDLRLARGIFRYRIELIEESTRNVVGVREFWDYTGLRVWSSIVRAEFRDRQRERNIDITGTYR